jgi:hypothetical protein
MVRAGRRNGPPRFGEAFYRAISMSDTPKRRWRPPRPVAIAGQTAIASRWRRFSVVPNLGIIGLFNRSEEWMAGTGLRGASLKATRCWLTSTVVDFSRPTRRRPCRGTARGNARVVAGLEASARHTVVPLDQPRTLFRLLHPKSSCRPIRGMAPFPRESGLRNRGRNHGLAAVGRGHP